MQALLETRAHKHARLSRDAARRSASLNSIKSLARGILTGGVELGHLDEHSIDEVAPVPPPERLDRARVAHNCMAKQAKR